MPSDETPTLDPATLALARLGAAVLNGDILQVMYPTPVVLEEVVATPGIRKRVAELLHDTEARERREDEGNA
jgi:hypothetical protein